MLDEKKNNYIMSVYKQGLYFGLAVCDISTGDFYTTQIKQTNNFEKLLDEIARYTPAEIVGNELLYETTSEITKIKERFNCFISHLTEKEFSQDVEKLKNDYKIVNDKEERIEDFSDKLFCICAINGLLEYLNQTQKIKLEHINTIKLYTTTRYMALDISARRNLEITEKLRDKSKKGTLLWVLDKTATSMGGRHLRRWLNDPLLDVSEINYRLSGVKELKENVIYRGDIIDTLKKVYDIESSKAPILQNLYQELDELTDIYELIQIAIVDDPPMTIKEGGIIKLGYHEMVDKYRKATTEGKQWVIDIEQKEKEATGIKNLKVSYNKVFGYFLEVTKSYLNLVPDRYIRKQTLANCERYITEELKEIENQILGAEEKIISLEYNLFLELRNKIASQIERIQTSASVVSTIDVLCSFAQVAEDLNYVMPIVDNSGEIEIKDRKTSCN